MSQTFGGKVKIICWAEEGAYSGRRSRFRAVNCSNKRKTFSGKVKQDKKKKNTQDVQKLEKTRTSSREESSSDVNEY